MTTNKKFINLGLSSGTLWSNINEEGYFTFDETNDRFGDNVPTIGEWMELINNCKWVWDFYNNQMIVIGKNGNKITFPITGCQIGKRVYIPYFNFSGHYWSSSIHVRYPKNAYYMFFNLDFGSDICCDLREYAHAVRLVKRK